MKATCVLLIFFSLHTALLAQIVPEGHNNEEYAIHNVKSVKTVYQPDPEGNAIVNKEQVFFEMEFGESGRLLKKYQLFLWEAVSYSYTFTYNYSASGQLIEEFWLQKILNLTERDENYIRMFGGKPLNQRIFYYYNSDGQLSRKDIFNYTDEFSDTTFSQSVEYEYENGLKIEEASSSPDEKLFNRNFKISYQYDSLGNLIKKIRTFGKDYSLRRTTTYMYNDDNQLVEEKTIDDSFPHNNVHFKYTYNSQGRMHQKFEFDPVLEDFELLTTYEYDRHGNAIEGDRTVEFSYNEKGLITRESWIETTRGERITFITNYEYF